MELSYWTEKHEAALAEIRKVVVGQEELVEGALLALYAGGHALIEGPPGLGKTILVRTLGRVLDCQVSRIQFTPDLMPSDIVGHSVWDMGRREFTFNPGPVFTNLLLADEINRSPPKTQSAMLEVMQEGAVTVDGRTMPLDGPFLVLATQNPLEHEGTYPLPEAQTDRFLFKLRVDYPDVDDETRILEHYHAGRDPWDLDSMGVRPVLDAATIAELRGTVTKVHVEAEILTYIANIVARTRDWHAVSVGASPRASIGLLLASRALAAVSGRDFVIPEDVKELAAPVLRHRLSLRPEAEIEGLNADLVVAELLESVEVPRS